MGHRTTGLVPPGAAVNDTAVGAIAWLNPENILTPGDPAATAVLLITQLGNYLRASTFGFALPSDANVWGIGLRVDRKGSILSAVQDSSVRLTKAGVAVGDNRAVGTAWPDTTTSRDYGDLTQGGDAGDLWGTTWTAAEVNASGFGAALSVEALLGVTASADHFQITVWYTVPEMIGPARRYVSVGDGMGRSG